MNRSLFTRGFTLKRQLVTPTLQVTRLCAKPTTTAICLLTAKGRYLISA